MFSADGRPYRVLEGNQLDKKSELITLSPVPGGIEMVRWIRTSFGQLKHSILEAKCQCTTSRASEDFNFPASGTTILDCTRHTQHSTFHQQLSRVEVML